MWVVKHSVGALCSDLRQQRVWPLGGVSWHVTYIRANRKPLLHVQNGTNYDFVNLPTICAEDRCGPDSREVIRTPRIPVMDCLVIHQIDRVVLQIPWLSNVVSILQRSSCVSEHMSLGAGHCGVR